MRGFARRVSHLSVANAANGILGLIFVPVAVFRLGPEGYGIFAIYTVLAGYVALVDLGVGKNLVRLLAGTRDEQVRRDHLRLALGFYLAVAGALVVLAPLLGWLVPRVLFPVDPEVRWVVQFITLCALGEYALGIPVALLQNRCMADERFDRYSRFIATSGALRYGILFGAVTMFPRPEFVVLALVSRRLIEAPVALAIMGGLPAGSWRPRWEPADFGRMLAHSSLFSAAQLLQLTVVSIGAILVNAVFGLRALGVYRATFDLASRVWFFSNTLGYVVFPSFVRLLGSAEGRGRLAVLLPTGMRISWLAFGVLGVTGVALGPTVLSVIGLRDQAFTVLFVPIIVGVAFNAHTNLAYEFVQAAGRYRAVIGLVALSLTVMVATFALLAGAAGLVAIGWAWLVSQGTYGLVGDGLALGALGRPVAWMREMLVRLLVLGGVVCCVVAALGLAAPAFWAAGLAGLVVAAGFEWGDVSALWLAWR